MRVALRGADGHPGCSGDLFEGQTDRVFQDDNPRLVGRDLTEAAVELAPELGPVGLTGGIGVRRRATILEQRLAGLTFGHVAASVDRQAVQPRRELRLAAELADPRAELGKCLLGRIPGILGIAQEVPGKLFHSRGMAFAERRQRVPVAVFCSSHQNRIAQPGIDQRPFRAEGLGNWTAAATGQLHLCALV